jgi:hypothetical protein
MARGVGPDDRKHAWRPVDAESDRGARLRRNFTRSMQYANDQIAGPGRATSSALAVRLALQRQPVATSAALVKAPWLTAAKVNKSLVLLERLGIVGELSNRRRGRVFSYRGYVERLSVELDGG